MRLAGEQVKPSCCEAAGGIARAVSADTDIFGKPYSARAALPPPHHWQEARVPEWEQRVVRTCDERSVRTVREGAAIWRSFAVDERNEARCPKSRSCSRPFARTRRQALTRYSRTTGTKHRSTTVATGLSTSWCRNCADAPPPESATEPDHGLLPRPPPAATLFAVRTPS